MDPAFVINNAVSSMAMVLSIGIVAWSVVSLTRVFRGKKIQAQIPPEALKSIEARMERLEQSNEAIALQVERIAEGQRFVTRLLSSPESHQARLPTPNRDPA